jgi:hypothetical protein
MTGTFTILRTTTSNTHFQLLVAKLDNELWNELKENQAQYDQYNNVPDINTAVVLYHQQKPISIGCYKVFNESTVEIKRMYVDKAYRGMGCAKQVLAELEKWATEQGYLAAVLETSIHFSTARALYTNAGYVIVPNYGQYAEMAESVCMQKTLLAPSEFKNLKGIEYFGFEEDFVEENVRCIPMIVRFKMDAAGIKLKLAEWSKFSVAERVALALNRASTPDEAKQYNLHLVGLVKKYTNTEATALAIDPHPEWSIVNAIPGQLQQKLAQYGWELSIAQWKQLTNLQRFALLKLCKQGHESKNLPIAMQEFGLIPQIQDA